MKAFLARRSAVFALSAAALLGGLAALPAQAQSFPAKPIKLVVPYAPGGGVDIVARTLADYISTKLGKLVIVENRTGAGGNVGSAFVAKSDPDGYTLLLGSNANAIHNNLYAHAGYNAATDLTHIG